MTGANQADGLGWRPGPIAWCPDCARQLRRFESPSRLLCPHCGYTCLLDNHGQAVTSTEGR